MVRVERLRYWVRLRLVETGGPVDVRVIRKGVGAVAPREPGRQRERLGLDARPSALGSKRDWGIDAAARGCVRDAVADGDRVGVRRQPGLDELTGRIELHRHTAREIGRA